MGWLVVLDPYVACLADSDNVCNKIVATIHSSADHAFILDEDQALLGKYEQLAVSNPESLIRDLYKYLVEQQCSGSLSGSSHVLSRRLSRSESEYCCDPHADQVEKVMVGLASGQKCTALVTLDARLRSKCPTSWLFWTEDCYQKVRDQHNVCFKFTDSSDWLSDPHSPVPNTKQSLEAFLMKYGEGSIRETQELEFKCPANPDQGLTQPIARKTREAMCAMANSGGGYVFVGIKDDGSIPGISLVYDGKPRSQDEILRILYCNHSDFRPDEPVDRQWSIKVAEDRYVFVFWVGKKRSNNYTYKGDRFVRVGTQSLKR